MRIDSNTVTLGELITSHTFFNIPIYQRLYVWGEDQVKTLLEDIGSAVEDGKDLYYLGGVLVVEKDSLPYGKVYDLIDGQQRFTTLWMMAIVFRDALEPFIGNLDRNQYRIHFAIREPINHYFHCYINGDTHQKATPHIEDALALIKSYKDKLGIDNVRKFASFICEKVNLIFTEVPKQMDLNKLFEIINNRGVQLQHHEILKARLLNKLSSEDRVAYSILWEACSNMNNYVEKNLRHLAKKQISSLFDNAASIFGEERLAVSKSVLAEIDVREKSEPKAMKLMDILSDRVGEPSDVEDVKGNSEEDFEDNEVRSIITFPMLLQHTLRIYLKKNQRDDIDKILDKELLHIFSTHFGIESTTEKKVKEFIELLWQVRYYFDKHVIKWVMVEEGNETHLICKLDKQPSKGRYYLRRVEASSTQGEELLQSMLYHSQQITTHYWLTPYLMYLIDFKGQGSYEYLKHLDNHLLCSQEGESLIIRTRKFLNDYYYRAELSTQELTQSLGTSFPHYWFYKLEFVLWDTYATKKNVNWKNFRLTAKNSVEHVSPQTQKNTDTNTVSARMINCFGNLALVSRSINSEYSNLPFNEKRQRFLNNNRDKLDSLKMDFIYENENWNDTLAEKHQEEMINLLNRYLGI